jgi:hypothetical protein
MKHNNVKIPTSAAMTAEAVHPDGVQVSQPAACMAMDGLLPWAMSPFLVHSETSLPSRLPLLKAGPAHASVDQASHQDAHEAAEDDNAGVLTAVAVRSIQGMAVPEEDTCSLLEEDLAGVQAAVGSILEELVNVDNADAADACVHMAAAGVKQLLDCMDQVANCQAAVLVGSASFQHSASFEPAAPQLLPVSIIEKKRHVSNQWIAMTLAHNTALPLFRVVGTFAE